MTRRFSGKTIVVTGSGRDKGLGQAISRGLAYDLVRRGIPGPGTSRPGAAGVGAHKTPA